jgi:hypothetical protein
VDRERPYAGCEQGGNREDGQNSAYHVHVLRWDPDTQ